MGMRFRKSVKIAPGVKLNLGKKSASVTFGAKGLHHTISSTGKKTTTIGVPGTGISYSTSSNSGSKHSSGNKKRSVEEESNNFSSAPYPDPNKKKWYQKTGWIIALLIFFFPVGLYLMWKYTNWGKKTKIVITTILVLLCIFFWTPSSSDTSNSSGSGGEKTESVEQKEENSSVAQTKKKEQNKKTEEDTTKEDVVETATPDVTENSEQVESENASISAEDAPVATVEPTQEIQETPVVQETPVEQMVWIPSSGTKYHSHSGCSGMDGPRQVTISEAEAMGYEPCKRCY